MRFLRWTVRAPTFAVVLLAACSSSKPEARIATVIRDHLSEIAPAGYDSVSWSDITVDVIETDTAGDLLAARFQAYDPRHPASATDTMRGPVFTAYVEDDAADGYVVRAYDEELARSVAVLTAAERRSRYADLIDAMNVLRDSVRPAISAWMKPRRQEFREASPTRQEALRKEFDAFVPAEELRSGIAARWSPPAGLEWGVIDEMPENGAELVYLRQADRPEEVCAYRVGPTVPETWNWVVSAFTTCRGREAPYVEQYPPETILAELRDHGMVRTPDS